MLRPEHLWAPLWATNGTKEVNHAKAYFRSLWWRSWSSRRPGWKWKKLAVHLCLWLSGFLKPENKNTEGYYSWPCLNGFLKHGFFLAHFIVASNTFYTSQDQWLNSGESGLVITCFNYRAGDVGLAQEDLVHGQLRFVVIDVLNCNVDFHKGLQSYKNTAGHR